MTNQFEELLESLGKIFHLSLKADHSNACSIQIHDNFTVQLQLDPSQENLWIFSKIIEIPPGKFRENVFQETLKENGKPDPRPAFFCYLAQTNHLALFQAYPISILNGEILAGLIGAFLQLGESWQVAIASGKTAPIENSQNFNTNPFGLK